MLVIKPATEMTSDELVSLHAIYARVYKGKRNPVLSLDPWRDHLRAPYAGRHRHNVHLYYHNGDRSAIGGYGAHTEPVACLDALWSKITEGGIGGTVPRNVRENAFCQMLTELSDAVPYHLAGEVGMRFTDMQHLLESCGLAPVRDLDTAAALIDTFLGVERWYELERTDRGVITTRDTLSYGPGARQYLFVR